MCAVSVCLTEKQLQFYLMAEDSVPHLSLSKDRSQTGPRLDLFVKNCVYAKDWRQIGEGVNHSESLGAFMTECKHEIETEWYPLTKEKCRIIA